MLITAIESSVVSVPFTMGGPYWSFAGKTWDRLDILLVRVETDDGLVGWGEAFGHAGLDATRAALDHIVAPLAVGADAGDINALTRRVAHSVHLLGRNGAFVYALSGVEIALWDLLGKRAGLPLWRILGGSQPGRLDAYASLLSYRGDVELVGKCCAAARDQGYRGIKLHEVDRDSVLAAKSAAPECDIMLDVNCAWLPAAARAAAGSMEHDGLRWLEEPVWPPEDAAGLASLRRYGIPLAAGENTAGLFGFRTLIEAGAIDIAQPSVTKVGGIGEMVRIINLANAHGVELMPHSPYFGPGFLATLHVSAALIERPLVEVLWMDMEANPFEPFVSATDGTLAVPDGPGLGCDPDPHVLKAYAKGSPVRTERS